MTPSKKHGRLTKMNTCFDLPTTLCLEPARRLQLAWLVVLLFGQAPARALDYEVYPGSAYYLTQMVSSVSFPYTAQFANGFYYNPWAFGDNSDTVLSTQQKQAICNNFSNRFVMIEGDQNSDDPNVDLGDIKTMTGLGMTPVAAFVNQPAAGVFWQQLVHNNGALHTPSYEMLPPWWVGQGSGWSGWTKQQTNMLVWGCAGSGVDSPVNLYFTGNGISASAYQQAVWDQCQWSQLAGKKFNYLASPNTDTGQQFLLDMERVARSLEDNAAEPNVYGVELYGVRPINLVPETTNYNGVVQANWTITGLAYYLLKHRDGDPGTLSLYATSNGVNFAQSVISPILTNAAQIIPFDPTQTNQFTLTLTNLSAWLDYAAVLRARTAQAGNWNITFKLGTSDISSSVLNHGGYAFLSSHRLLPKTAQQVIVTLSPKVLGAPTPLDLVIEALPHAGVDQALDVIAFQYQANQSPPTLDFPTNNWFTLQGMGFAPIWFTVGDAETISTQLTITAVSGNTTLVPNNNIVFGQSGIQRWVTISPVSSQWGSAPVTLIVSDSQFSVSNTFNVFVQQTNTLPYVKANNVLNLELTNSWVTNVVPDEFGVAVWDTTVTTANTTTLGDDEAWAGIQIKNPGGAITINGTNTLGLGAAGVDMSGASQNFTMNCPAELDADVNCNIASGRVMTINGIISSSGGITKSGSGLLVLSGSNTYSGGIGITSTSGSKNPLLASNSLALGTGSISIGGGGNNDAACLELAGGITLGNSLSSWASRNTTAPNLLNVSGTNKITSSISAGNGGGQSTLESDSGDLVMTGNISTRQLNLLGAGNGELQGVVDTSGYNLVMNGPGRWTLSANNTYSGSTIINGGTLVVGNAGGLGTTNGSTVVTNGGTLDVNGFNITAEPVTVSGAGVGNNGAIVNQGAAQTTALRTLTLAGSTTLGGANRWDIRNSGGTASLATTPAGSPYNLTKVGTNQISLVGVNPIDAALGDIKIQQGTFAVQNSTDQLGNPNNTITISSGATLELWTLTANPLNKKIVVNAGGTIFDEKAPSIIAGTVALNGTAIFNAANNGTPPTLTMSSGISGAGGLVVIGGGNLVLLGTNTYAGNTTISSGTLNLANNGSISTSAIIVLNGGGTLDATERSDATLTVATGQTLTGNGTVIGDTFIGNGATFAPGGSLTTMTFSNDLTLNGGSVTVMELNQTLATNDGAQVTGKLTCGGTLVVTNLAGTLARGNSYKLFAATNIAGGFNNVVLPALTAGLTWSNRLTLDGTILVVAASPIHLTEVFTSSKALQFNWTNSNVTFHLQSQTNPLKAGLDTNWFDYPGGTTAPVNVPIDKAGGGAFFRLISP